MVRDDQEHERRTPWGEYEHASSDALRMLYEAVSNLPDGEAKEDIASFVRGAEGCLDYAVDIAQTEAHRSRRT